MENSQEGAQRPIQGSWPEANGSSLPTPLPQDTNAEAGPSGTQPPEGLEGGDEPGMMDDSEGFDPDTLANLAALSRIDEATGEEIVNYLRSQPGLSPLIDGVDDQDHDTDADARGESTGTGTKRKRKTSKGPGGGGSESEEELRKVDLRGRSVDAEGESEAEFGESTYGEDGKSKRKRNRTVLSCTECHRRKQHCDRNIPCSRCIKRGVPGMCRMEAPPITERKKKDLIKDIPIDEELGVRIQALESLIRSGSSLDPDSASTAAMETILHATRAANSGSQDATTALAQLTESALSGSGIGGMSADAQSSLLMEVLQQLSSVTQGRNGEVEADSSDVWSGLPTARPDPVARVSTAYNADASSSKLDLSLPGFRDDAGRPFVPPTVRHVEKQLRNTELLAREALPIWGDERFLAEGIKFAYGADHGSLKLDHITAVQASTLTGALRLAGTFLARFPSPPGKAIYVPSPTTEEDTATLRDAGLEIKHYRFLDRKTGGVDFEGLQADLQAAPSKSAVLLHVSGSTPTGVDFSETQWRTVIGLLQDRNLIPLVMLAFQGLATGNVVKDVQPLRLMAQEGLPVVLCQSFDAMMGLYSESPAIVSVVAQSAHAKSRVESQLRAVARGLHGHPSPWGAQVAHTILSDPKLHPAWLTEIKAMSDRLRSVREKLYDLLANKFKTPGNWIHLKRSVGMYSTTLLSPLINEHLASKRHVHLLPHGSFSLGSLNSTRIELLARSIDSAVLSSIHEAEQAQAQHIAMELALAAVKEAAAREEAEAAAADAAREEDRVLMEKSIASAIEAQRRAEEEERDREEDDRRRAEEDAELDAAVRKAAERAQIARQAEAILASIGGGM